MDRAVLEAHGWHDLMELSVDRSPLSEKKNTAKTDGESKSKPKSKRGKKGAAEGQRGMEFEDG